ncbi:hypothetical protein KUF71_013428 [Frankliniella fusca]|uniref:Uncharacterized protein n=1 Tax=Frankliniella fusca TaxID=407009 RepID=A0AAE1LNJ8_9NEOP|nr:hypothetical protein KUF71_013428 [Frankliniella fusca]
MDCTGTQNRRLDRCRGDKSWMKFWRQEADGRQPDAGRRVGGYVRCKRVVVQEKVNACSARERLLGVVWCLGS